MNDMNCKICHETLVDLVEATANAPSLECETLRAHLRGCEPCKELASEMLETYSLMALSLPPAEVPGDFESRVLARIAERGADANEGAVTTVASGSSTPTVHLGSPSDESSSRLRLLSYVLAAGLLVAVAGGQWLHLKRLETAATASRDPSEEERIASLERAVAEMRELQKQAERPEIRFVSFRPGDAMPDAGVAPTIAAHAVWDSMTNQIHFFGFDMKPLGNGETYAIWFQVEEEYILATSFDTNADGLANVVAHVSGDEAVPTVPKQLIVSVERKPVGDRPSEQVWLKADFEKFDQPTQ